MKKIISVVLIVILLIAGYFAWQIMGPGTSFSKEKKYFYIHSGWTFDQVMNAIERDTLINSTGVFKWVANRMDYPQKVKAGKYPVKKGMSILNIIRMLKNGQQEPVNLVITKIRTKEDFAALIGRKFECDSLAFVQYLNNNDSLHKYHLDTNTVMTIVIPDTYSYFWNTTPSRIFTKLVNGYENFWDSQRRSQATIHGLTPQTAYILASIVEEETTRQEDKGKIASVYLNRLEKGMRLSADPTIKFALRDFGLKRIYDKYLAVSSPYNTYINNGLPPGPICTPSTQTIDAVLTSPKTNYLFFVAKPDLSGYSNFAETYTEHMKYAKEYQQWLDKFLQQKTTANDNLAH